MGEINPQKGGLICFFSFFLFYGCLFPKFFVLELRFFLREFFFVISRSLPGNLWKNLGLVSWLPAE